MNTYQITPPTFSLPKQLAELGHLAYNLWWSWNPEALRLYRRIDPVLWERVEHNPVRFLQQVARKNLNAAAQDNTYLEGYRRVLAAFNGGFKAEHGHFGAMVAGEVALPPRPGLGTLAIETDGRVRLGVWGSEIVPSATDVAWRQNGPLIVHDGEIDPQPIGGVVDELVESLPWSVFVDDEGSIGRCSHPDKRGETLQRSKGHLLHQGGVCDCVGGCRTDRVAIRFGFC